MIASIVREIRKLELLNRIGRTVRYTLCERVYPYKFGTPEENEGYRLIVFMAVSNAHMCVRKVKSMPLSELVYN